MANLGPQFPATNYGSGSLSGFAGSNLQTTTGTRVRDIISQLEDEMGSVNANFGDLCDRISTSVVQINSKESSSAVPGTGPKVQSDLANRLETLLVRLSQHRVNIQELTNRVDI